MDIDNIETHPWRDGWRFQFLKVLCTLICAFGLPLGVCCSMKIFELNLFQGFLKSIIIPLSALFPFFFCMYIAFRFFDYFEGKIEEKWWGKSTW